MPLDDCERVLLLAVGTMPYRICVTRNTGEQGDVYPASIDRDDGYGWRTVHRDAGRAEIDITLSLCLPWIMQDWMREHLALDEH